MVLKEISFATPQENILFDEVLLELAEQGGEEVLRFWESEKLFIVLGKICQPQDDLQIQNILNDNVPVLRRSSGGGTVLQGKGCLNYSLILSKENHPEIISLGKSYQFILGKIIQALQSLNMEAFFQPISDISMRSKDQAGFAYKKISGNAQKRGKKFILHHGTILYDFNFSVVERYLKIPKNVPEYRRGRSHTEFLTNTLQPKEKIITAISKVFDIQKKESTIKINEERALEALLKKRKIVLDFKDLSGLL